MKTFFYADKDATLYNRFPYLNSGQDSIIELNKTAQSGSDDYVSRILLKFDLTELSASLINGSIVNPTYYLNLYTIDTQEIPLDYDIDVFAVSQSWEMGTGKEDNVPQTKEGVSWYYRDGYTPATGWATASLAPGSTYYEVLTPGGGTWYNSPSASQHYSYESSDLHANVTEIVNDWISGSRTNDGFIVKRRNADETSADEIGNIQFFSRETHTIYEPRLEVCWDDSVFSTGSLTALTDDDSMIVYLKQFKESYNLNEKTKIRVIGRPAFPVRTYSTSSNYTTVSKYLPSSSYYAVYDAHTEEPIISFDSDFTKLSCDSNGNYFNLWMQGLEPERYYRLKFKVDFGSTVKYFDQKFYFKVVR